MKWILTGIVSLTLLVSCKQEQSCNCQLNEYSWWKPQDKYFVAALQSLHFITETQSISQVDSAYRQFQNGYGMPMNAMSAANGEFTGVSLPDAYGYRHAIILNIHNGKIIRINYNEVKDDGHSKRADVAYGQEMKKYGCTPYEAYTSMEKQLLEKQNLADIDAVSGATYSYYRFRYAAWLALMKANKTK